MQTNEPDIRYCRCKKCNAPMILGWDQRHQEFCAICEPCTTFMPLRLNEKPPYEIN